MRVPPGRINEIANGKRNVTAETWLRLSAALGTTAQFWVNLQAHYDLEIAQEQFAALIEKEVLPLRSGD